jgi:hypothetical protein
VGYVLVKRHPLNRRLRVYSLNYKHNLTIVGEHTNNRAPQYGNGHASSDPSSEIGVVTNFGPPIVGEQNRQDHEFKQEGESKYIPLSGSLNKSRESDALSCIEGWQLDSRAIADGIEDVLHDERLSSKSESTSSTDEHAGLFGVERQFSERLQAAAGDPKAQHEIMNEYRTWEAFGRPDDWEH